MSTPAAFDPQKIDFGGVPPGRQGPDISVDPSLGPPAISFAGGVSIHAAPADDQDVASIESDPAGIFRVRDLILLEWTLEPADPSELPPGHRGRPPMVKVLEIVSQTSGAAPVAVKKGQFLLVRAAYSAPASATASPGGLIATLCMANYQKWPKRGDLAGLIRLPQWCVLKDALF